MTVTLDLAAILLAVAALVLLAAFIGRYELAALLRGKRDGTHRRSPRAHAVCVDPAGVWEVIHSWSLLGVKYAIAVQGSEVMALFRGPGCVRRATRYVRARMAGR